jgi:hypothetical protein
VGHYIANAVRIRIDLEIEAPIVVDTGLPAVIRFIVLFGAQAWMSQVPHKKIDLLYEGLLNRQGSRCQRFDSAPGEVYVHFLLLVGLLRADFFLRKAATSPPVLNGP